MKKRQYLYTIPTVLLATSLTAQSAQELAGRAKWAKQQRQEEHLDFHPVNDQAAELSKLFKETNPFSFEDDNKPTIQQYLIDHNITFSSNIHPKKQQTLQAVAKQIQTNNNDDNMVIAFVEKPSEYSQYDKDFDDESWDDEEIASVGVITPFETMIAESQFLYSLDDENEELAGFDQVQVDKIGRNTKVTGDQIAVIYEESSSEEVALAPKSQDPYTTLAGTPEIKEPLNVTSTHDGEVLYNFDEEQHIPPAKLQEAEEVAQNDAIESVKVALPRSFESEQDVPEAKQPKPVLAPAQQDAIETKQPKPAQAPETLKEALNISCTYDGEVLYTLDGEEPEHEEIAQLAPPAPIKKRAPTPTQSYKITPDIKSEKEDFVESLDQIEPLIPLPPKKPLTAEKETDVLAENDLIPLTTEEESLPEVQSLIHGTTPNVEATPTPTPTPTPAPTPQPEVQPTAKSSRKKTVRINFKDVKMGVVLNYLGRETGKNFIFDEEELNFRVTILSSEPTPIENIIPAILQELRIRGLSLIQIGNNFIIHKNELIKTPAQVVTDKNKETHRADVITRVFRLKNADPINLVTVIQPMLSEGALVEAVPNSRSLVVTGLASNVERLAQLIEAVDSPEASLQIGSYRIFNTTVKNAVDIAEKLFAPIARDTSVVFSADTDSNTVFIVSTEPIIAKALDFFRKLDREQKIIPEEEGLSLEEREARQLQFKQQQEEKRRRPVASGPLGSTRATKFFIHKLQFRQGQEIRDALKDIASSLENSSEENYDLVTTIDTIQWIESSNSLVFTGTEDSIALVRELIEEIDVAVAQVLIEVLILETTLDDSLNYGVDLGNNFSNGDLSGAQSFLSSGSPLTGVLNNGLSGAPNDASGLATRAGFNLGVIGRKVTYGGVSYATLGGLIQALHLDTTIDVVLNPKILVEDNRTAEIFVRVNTAFQTEAITNDQGNVITGSVEFRDVGSLLKVTPLIGNGGIITLDIEQENSSTEQAANTGSSGSSSTTNTTTASPTDVSPTTRKSTTKTRIHVPDGFFTILSGQVRNERTSTRAQVPCLGGAPFIGGLFSQKRAVDEKRNLILFIRPTIIALDEIDYHTKRQQRAWNEQKRRPKRWKTEVDGALDFFNVKRDYLDPETYNHD